MDLSDARIAARELLGSHLIRWPLPRQPESDIGHVPKRPGRRARIVETEAYWQEDPASHSFAGKTPRNEIMFGEPGFAYVYQIHRVFCLNLVTGPAGRGEAVLIRAVEPILGVEQMAESRASRTAGILPPKGYSLTNGPGKLCQAFDVVITDNGTPLFASAPQTRLAIEPFALHETERVVTSTRVGISKARDELMRFSVEGNPWVSSVR